jgi:hypothetical protein
MSKCGCGRSPTGMCKGWHGLSQEEYEAKLRNEYGKKLEYNSSLGTSDFWVLLYDLFRSNYVQ